MKRQSCQDKPVHKSVTPRLAIECPDAELIRRLRTLLNDAGFHVCASCDSGQGGHSARIVLGISLTDREVEVLQSLCDHSTHAAASRSLGMKESTFDRHLANIRKKLKLESTVQVVAWGFRTGIIE